MIKIILADDHKMILDGFRSIFAKEEDIVIIGEALDGEQVLDILKKEEADVAVLDISMPNLDGLETTRKIKRDYPNVKILVLTMHIRKNYVQELIEEGVSGYIIKNKGINALVEAVRDVYNGKRHISPEIFDIYIKSRERKYMDGTTPLTKREKEVLRFIGKGCSTREISGSLCIAHSTVETHRRNLIDKLGVRSSKELVIYAVKNGYAED